MKRSPRFPYGIVSGSWHCADIRKSGQSLHIDFLAIKRGAVVRICLHGRSEVLDRNEFVVIAQKCLDKADRIKPLVRCPL